MVRKYFTVLVFVFALFRISAQQIELVDHHWIDKIKSNKTDSVYVINFWATWCKTCVTEIQDFEKFNEQYKNKNVKVILVSHDMKKQMDSHLRKFIREKFLKSDIAFMNESNLHKWIDGVDINWTGGLPVTLVICGAKNFKRFYETELSFAELEEIVKPLIGK